MGLSAAYLAHERALAAEHALRLHRESGAAPEIQMAMDYIQQYHVAGISWHTTLNNHASTRPKAYGGKPVHSVTACKEFEQSPGSAPVSDSAQSSVEAEAGTGGQHSGTRWTQGGQCLLYTSDAADE